MECLSDDAAAAIPSKFPYYCCSYIEISDSLISDSHSGIGCYEGGLYLLLPFLDDACQVRDPMCDPRQGGEFMWMLHDFDRDIFGDYFYDATELGTYTSCSNIGNKCPGLCELLYEGATIKCEEQGDDEKELCDIIRSLPLEHDIVVPTPTTPAIDSSSPSDSTI
mmetsp:Transcript_16735/g.27769  ORF Transcript_16735/g.27769 Transcript_16735/m.27769 type:complete len:165 (-) Transcript_16735:316-810(-)